MSYLLTAGSHQIPGCGYLTHKHDSRKVRVKERIPSYLYNADSEQNLELGT